MNDLSWLIYWADAAPNLSTFVAITAFFLFVLSLIGTFLFICSRSSVRKVKVWDDAMEFWRSQPEATRGKAPSTYDNEYRLASDDRNWASISPSLRFFPYLAALFFVLWGGSFLVPSKDTFYMIAASEAGEEAVQTPEFTKVRKVLNKWLDDQLIPTPEPQQQQTN